MPSKVILLTGGNSGIGKAAAIELARSGAELTLVCRDRERAEKARGDILRSSGARSLDLILADLTLLSEAQRVAKEFTSTHARLDVLVNNAGSNFPEYAETSEGLERTMALNYYAPWALTQGLLPLLRSSAPSRVVNVASVAHFSGRLDLNNPNGKGDMGVGGLGAYSRSKLALVLYTYELARRLKGSGVTVNCLHPGAVRTHIWAHAGRYRILVQFASLFMLSPKAGARTLVFLATSPEVEGVSGTYFEKCREKTSSARSRDPKLAVDLWELTERVVKAGRFPPPAAP
ncbi:MAG: SDR family oxidoreductase [Euryarchaeota archaeon]|nr:SDR family oxidoreductase [Euryarchaeota archaeon]MDE1837306.1 SDR family oxidoreductase [Euryarchaeota archaeon]MDE1879822.1 SDR family oxidoreductase [Euryarchaeota archaeon]MDE2045263.1 SDR family oxidoreductase [Thermoplasmata archaeon]